MGRGGQTVPNEYSILSQTQLSRRGFVQSVGLAAGGLVVGLVPAGCARQQPPTPLTAADVNAYIRISSNDEVSIVVPGAELGQGIYTSLPKIVAEELEADWDRVVVRLAHADAAFVNPNFARLASSRIPRYRLSHHRNCLSPPGICRLSAHLWFLALHLSLVARLYTPGSEIRRLPRFPRLWGPMIQVK